MAKSKTIIASLCGLFLFSGAFSKALAQTGYYSEGKLSKGYIKSQVDAPDGTRVIFGTDGTQIIEQPNGYTHIVYGKGSAASGYVFEKIPGVYEQTTHEGWVDRKYDDGRRALFKVGTDPDTNTDKAPSDQSSTAQSDSPDSSGQTSDHNTANASDQPSSIINNSVDSVNQVGKWLNDVASTATPSPPIGGAGSPAQDLLNRFNSDHPQPSPADSSGATWPDWEGASPGTSLGPNDLIPSHGDGAVAGDHLKAPLAPTSAPPIRKSNSGSNPGPGPVSPPQQSGTYKDYYGKRFYLVNGSWIYTWPNGVKESSTSLFHRLHMYTLQHPSDSNPLNSLGPP